jgi:carbonic anhydrase/acetyltransferase-like protein (isoleucine patch superfamily)
VGRRSILAQPFGAHYRIVDLILAVAAACETIDLVLDRPCEELAKHLATRWKSLSGRMRITAGGRRPFDPGAPTREALRPLLARDAEVLLLWPGGVVVPAKAAELARAIEGHRRANVVAEWKGKESRTGIVVRRRDEAGRKEGAEARISVEGPSYRIEDVRGYFEASMDFVRNGYLFAQASAGEPDVADGGSNAAARIEAGGEVRDSLVAPGCRIAGRVESSVLFEGVRIDRGAVVRECVVGRRNFLGSGAKLTRTVLDERTGESALLPNVGDRAVVGGEGKGKENREFPEWLGSGITFVGRDAEIPARAEVGRNCYVAAGAARGDFPRKRKVADGTTIGRPGEEAT